MRTTGVGVANSLSNVGAVVAPFVVFGLVSRGAAGPCRLKPRHIDLEMYLPLYSRRLLYGFPML